MLNFRKLRQDYSPSILKEGRALHDKKMVLSAKIVKLSGNSVRVSSRVNGQFDHTYNCEIEIDRHESTTLDADCDCTYKYDCNHLAALSFYLEEHLDELVVAYSKEPTTPKKGKTKVEADAEDDEEKEDLQEIFKVAESKEVARKGKKQQKELLTEYTSSSKILGQSPFFLPEEEIPQDKAELAIIFDLKQHIEVQLALRLPFRSKPLNVLNVKEFLEAVRYEEPIYIGSKRYFFGLGSFNPESAQLLKLITEYARFPEVKGERNLRNFHIDPEPFGELLARAYELAISHPLALGVVKRPEDGFDPLPCLYQVSLETPLTYCSNPCLFRFELEYMDVAAPKIMMKPKLILDNAGVSRSFRHYLLRMFSSGPCPSACVLSIPC